MAAVATFYDYTMSELSDKRVENWPLMSGIGPTLLIAAGYLATVLVIVPAFMKNRKAYNINTIIRYYNLFQVVACVCIIYGIASSGWFTSEFSWVCQAIDYSEDPNAVRMLSFIYYTYLLKMVELVETVFFLLRKKNNQVTNLHLYHHSSTFVLSWIGAKYVGGGSVSFPIMLNSFIHVLMYTYYYLSSLGPEWQQRLTIWKPRLTMAQMVQFAILLVQTTAVFTPGCQLPKGLLLLYIPNIVLIFYMFGSFYREAYTPKSETEEAD